MRPYGIHPSCVIGSPPEHRDYQLDGSFFKPRIHDTALLSAFCTVDGGMERPTIICARTFLNAHCHIGHDVIVGRDCELGAGTVVCGHVEIGDNVRIGGNTWIRPRIKIGANARIGGGSVVVKDVPAGTIVAGNPAKPLIKGRVHELMMGART